MKFKRALAGILTGAAIYCSLAMPARAQSSGLPYKQTFAAERFDSCELNSANLSNAPQNITIQTYDSEGKPIEQHVKNSTLRARVDSILQNTDTARSMTVSSPSLSRASIVCSRADSQGQTSAYSLPNLEFATRTSTFLTKGPQFSDSNTTWHNAHIVHNDTDRTLESRFMINRANERGGEDAWWWLWRQPGQSTRTFDIEFPEIQHARQQSANARWSLRELSDDTKIVPQLHHYQWLIGSDGGQIALHLPRERAAQEMILQHLYTPEEGQKTFYDWEQQIAITNDNAKETTAYITGYSADGAELPKIPPIKIKPYDTYTAPTQKIFGHSKVSWAKVNSSLPAFAHTIHKKGNQYVAHEASTPLDAGSSLVALNTRGKNGTSSHKIINVGGQKELVEIIAYDGNDVPQAKRTVELQPRQTLAGTPATILEVPPEQLTEVQYVRMNVQQPAAQKDLHNPVGKITGISIDEMVERAGTDRETRVLSGTKFFNADDESIMLQMGVFNPRTQKDFEEQNYGATAVAATVITNRPDGITGATYDPLRKGELTKGFSASLSTNDPARMFYATDQTVNGVVHTELGRAPHEATYVSDGKIYEYNPKITLSFTNGTIKTLDSKLFIGTADGYNVDHLLGAGASKKAVKENIEQYVNLVVEFQRRINPAIIEQEIAKYKQLTDGNISNGELIQVNLVQSLNREIAGGYFNNHITELRASSASPRGEYIAIMNPDSSASGHAPDTYPMMDKFKRFFGVSEKSY